MTGQDGTGVEMVDIKSVVSEQTLSSEQTLTSGLDVPANPRPRRPVVSGWSVQSGDSSTWGISQEWPLPQARYSEVDSQGSQPGTPFDSRSPTPTFYQGNFPIQSHNSLAPLMKGPEAPSTRFVETPSSSKYTITQESIEQLHKRDDVDLHKGWRRVVFRFAPWLGFLNTALYIFYLGLRIACVILAQNAQGIVYAGAWAFLAVEIMVAIPSQLHNFWTCFAGKKRHRPKLRLRGDEVPTVDAFITCCGEDDEVVLDTVRAALHQDYPRDRFRVLVLDDGKSAGLEAYINQLAAVHDNVFYVARAKFPGVPHHFKAGNLNNGLEVVDKMGAGEFMAALDADMIPEPDWLRALLPHMLIDPKMALVCPPQLFYNTPKSDPLAQSLNFFVHVIEPMKDALGVAWCTGSGYIIRREALTDIGNFPLGSIAEDVTTSTLMLGRGWKTSFVHEALQFGTVPEDFGSHLKQRTRWAIGTVQTAAKLNFCLWGKDVRGMTFVQRFSGFLYASLTVFTIFVTISMFVIPIVLAWGKSLIAYSDIEQLRWLIRSCFAYFMCNRVWEFSINSPAGYHTGQRDARGNLWMSPYISLSIIRSFFLPKWLGGQVAGFKPTGSLGSALNERDAANKKNMMRRLKAILFNYMAIFHFVFVWFTLSATVLTSYRVIYRDKGSKDLMIGLITHVFWPPVSFLNLCTSLWTPVAYAIDPPMVPDREELLIRDPKTGVAHPTEESKIVAFGGQAAWFEFIYTASTIYTALVFVYSFFL